MNREIKFRAWDFGNKRMVLGEAIGFTFITNTVFQDGDISATGEILLTEKVKLSELMQYTGLKDKNGKEIYEGDVVIVPNFNYEPDNGQNPKYLLPIGYQPTGFTVGKDWMSELSSDDYEIIGNIYENPDLLTQHNNHYKDK